MARRASSAQRAAVGTLIVAGGLLALGAIVSAAALRWAGQHGARRTYLQVTVDNTAAITLYERLGYAVHHDYVYRQAPD